MKKLILAAFALTTAASVFAQGSVILNNRVSVAGNLQTTHVWGPSASNPALSLIGLGSNDSPVGTTPFAASQMRLIGDGGVAGGTALGDGKLIMGYRSTLATLIGALGSGIPETSLQPLVPGGITTFRTGSSLGDVAGITMTIGTSGGPWQDAAWGTFEMVAWDNASGKYANWEAAKAAWQLGLIAAGHSNPVNLSGIGGTANLAPQLTQGLQLQSFNLYYIPEPSMFALAGLGAASLLIFRRRS